MCSTLYGHGGTVRRNGAVTGEAVHCNREERKGKVHSEAIKENKIRGSRQEYALRDLSRHSIPQLTVDYSLLHLLCDLPDESSPQMEMLLSAVLGEMITRSIDFFVGKFSKPQAQDVEDGLRRVLLRAQVIIDDAMGRQITNQAMLLQLGMLRGAMHRGYYILDTFRCQSHGDGDEGAKDQVSTQSSLFLYKINSLKSFSYPNRNTQILEQLQKVLHSLSSMILDFKEVVMFLPSYPRMYRQPYSMHLLLGNCMFARQTEAELVIKFLLYTHPHDPEELEVLPVVGPGKVGKSTLVGHVCKDERVRDHFSEVLWLRDHDFACDDLASREGCELKLQNHVKNLSKGKRLLAVVDLVGDLTEDAWNRFYFASKQSLPRGSKIIIISRSDKVVRYGTTQTLALKDLPLEAFWYFFRTLVFGSVDPEMHPGHVQVAMEIARMLNGGIHGALMVSSLLKDNFNITFWCKILTFTRMFIQKNISKFGGHPSDLLSRNRPTQLVRMAIPSEELVVSHQYQCSSQEDIPRVGMQDVVFGSFKAHGKFDVLLWRSRLPPYYSYMEMLVSTVLGEAIGRSIDFFISKCSKPQAEDVEGRLCSVLIRAQVIIDEAKGRQITNQAMLLQLELLRGAMHRGYYMLDTSRYQHQDKEDAEDLAVSQSLSLCKVNSLKSLRSFSRRTQVLTQLQEMLDSLNSMILDVNEMTMFLNTYPRFLIACISCWPTAYLTVKWRQNLSSASCCTQNLVTIMLRNWRSFLLSDLAESGKSTLVAHVCNDERVRDHFSEIVFLTDDDFRDETISVPGQGCAVEKQICTSKNDGRLLVVVEVAGDVTTDSWNKLCSAIKHSVSNGARIVITSQSDRITRLGTAGAITLKYLTDEAYWYFFRTQTFGSTDPKQHPRLASVAMEIAGLLSSRAFIAANIIASLLRDNFDINFWCKVLAFMRGLIQKHIANFGENPCDLLNQNRPTHLGRMSIASEGFLVYAQCHRCSQETVPNLTFADVFCGSVKAHGKFEVLAWRSQIPPYYNYVYTSRASEASEGFIAANVTASLLKDNFDISFWCKVLKFLRGLIQNHIANFGDNPCHLSSQETVPDITFADTSP
ncbi:hypothetical protein U9M48_011419 [Paspalum notatum var. saurae]|uniref:NB-ARC domain-containing protein n=1 Tax=Paspalum notatum var. saurae TaxID=547442 RepID=A0AAQ3SW73_PASNO